MQQLDPSAPLIHIVDFLKNPDLVREVVGYEIRVPGEYLTIMGGKYLVTDVSKTIPGLMKVLEISELPCIERGYFSLSLQAAVQKLMAEVQAHPRRFLESIMERLAVVCEREGLDISILENMEL